jgi:hypothetical protein
VGGVASLGLDAAGGSGNMDEQESGLSRTAGKAKVIHDPCPRNDRPRLRELPLAGVTEVSLTQQN